MTSQVDRITDLSGGIQNATSWQLRKPNEVEDAINGRFGEVIGSIVRRYGFQKQGNLLETNKSGLGLTEGKWKTGAQILGATNNSGDTETKIKSYNTGSGNWTDLTTPDPIDPNTRIQFADSLNETYAAGISNTTGNRMNVLNIVADEDTGVIATSKTRNLINCPQSRFITEFGGRLHAMNVQLGDTVYSDRDYLSSPALGVVTFIQGDQTDNFAPVDLIDNVPTMTSNTTPFGVAAASNEASPSFAAWKAFNDDTTGTDEWSTSATGGAGILSYDFGSGNSKTITYYSLVGVAQGESGTQIGPKTWTFESSNDGATWTVLDTQTNVLDWAKGEKRIYTIPNITAYRYYRINVTANQGNTGGNLIIAEFELLTSTQGTKDLQMKVDSVRYIKPGMSFDIYKGGTDTKIDTLLINTVDKTNNTFTFTPLRVALLNPSVASDTILSQTTDLSVLPSGTPIRFDFNGTPAGGLANDTIYYTIYSPSAIIESNPRSSSTNTDDSSIGAVAWTNPANANTNNGTSATVTLASNISHYLKAVGMFPNNVNKIPPDAVITGVTATVERSSSAAGTQIDYDVRLVKNGTIVGNNMATGTSIPGALTEQIFGTSTSLWGVTLTASDINNLNFGFVYSASGGSATVSVDYTQMTVYFTTAQGVKLATSLSNAKLGNAIDITSLPIGPAYLLRVYTFTDNDEVWLAGRHDELSYLWNTDYPTEQKADYLRIPPSVDADTAITAFGQTNNRLFLYTKNSTHKWDGANLPKVYEDIGCISNETVENIGDWIIWLDAEGKVRARNDASGQDELISRPIKNLLSNISESNLLVATAGRIDNTYKICLGTVGDSVLCLAYDYDTNTWGHDKYKIPFTAQMRSAISCTKKLYFLSNTGWMYQDDIGNLDDTDTIPFIVKLGRTMSKIEQGKNYHGAYFYSVNAAGATVKFSLDGSPDFITAGQLKLGVDKIPFSGIRGQANGRDINIEVSINTPSDRPQIDSTMVYFNQIEDKFGQPTSR